MNFDLTRRWPEGPGTSLIYRIVSCTHSPFALPFLSHRLPVGVAYGPGGGSGVIRAAAAAWAGVAMDGHPSPFLFSPLRPGTWAGAVSSVPERACHPSAGAMPVPTRLRVIRSAGAMPTRHIETEQHHIQLK